MNAADPLVETWSTSAVSIGTTQQLDEVIPMPWSVDSVRVDDPSLSKTRNTPHLMQLRSDGVEVWHRLTCAVRSLQSRYRDAAALEPRQSRQPSHRGPKSPMPECRHFSVASATRGGTDRVLFGDARSRFYLSSTAGRWACLTRSSSGFSFYSDSVHPFSGPARWNIWGYVCSATMHASRQPPNRATPQQASYPATGDLR